MENKTYVITDKDVFDYGLKQFIKDIQTILVDFNQKERIEIIDMFTLIAKSFLNEKHYSECYDIYETNFLRKYLQKAFNAEQLNIFDYFTYEGLRWNYSRILGKDDNQCSIEFVEEYKKEKTLDKRFNNLLKTYINDLQKLLHIVLVYDQNPDLETEENPAKTGHKTKTIKIDQGIIKDIEKLLHPYIDPIQHADLSNALNNIPITEKIIFKDKFNKLTDLFWNLIQEDVGFIKGYKTSLMNWLHKNFTYTDENDSIKDLDMEVLHKYIHSKKRKCEHPISGLDLFLINSTK